MCIVISQECKNIIVIQIKKYEKYHLLFFDDIHIFLSCTGWKDKKNMESDIITVNLDERDEISTKDLFSEIQLIPLETTPESLIRNITQIKFFEDRYYIHDYSRSQIFVFDREGHFQFALNEKGNGPGEYLNFTDL